MEEEIATPVTATTEAFKRGVFKTMRIRRILQNAPKTHVLDPLLCGQDLEKSLGQSEVTIKEAYALSLHRLGQSYVNAFADNHAASKLLGIRINLLELFSSLDDCILEPEAFDFGLIPFIKLESERCCDQVIRLLGDLHREVISDSSKVLQLPSEDKAQTRSVARESMKDARKSEGEYPKVQPKVSKTVIGSNPKFIGRLEVIDQLNKNDEFLRRRREAKIEFINGLHQLPIHPDAMMHLALRVNQISSVDQMSRFSPDSDLLPLSPHVSGYALDCLEGVERSDTASTRVLDSATIYPSFNAPANYPMDRLSQRMVGLETFDKPTFQKSTQSHKYPIIHSASFYKFGGFCKGAKMLLRGAGTLRVVKKPAGLSNAYISAARCVECNYEVGFDFYEKDEYLDRAGIYTLGAVRFRQKFLSKCHISSKQPDVPLYACLFCVQETKVIDEYDATVFFSVKHLIGHLEKHPKPMKFVEGLKILYGHEPNELDFDIHFQSLVPKPSPFQGDTFTSKPTAIAVVSHHMHAKAYKKLDPESRPTLQFVLGAKIVGITYPSRYNGAWCYGYHDSECGMFPASTVALDSPSQDSITMDRGSPLTATARWENVPKSNTSSWLKFNKKEKVACIAYPYQDFWCWSGMNSKGKWGIFPACFVEGLSGEMPTKGMKYDSGFSWKQLSFHQPISASPTSSVAPGTRRSRFSSFSSIVASSRASSVASSHENVSDIGMSKERSQIFVHKSSLQDAIANGSLETVEELLAKNFKDAARGEYSWLYELVDIGYNNREMAELLFQKSHDAPWIYFEPQNISRAAITPGLHIPACAHQGGQDLKLPSRLITAAPDFHSLELSGLTWPTKTENLKRIVAELCGIAGIAPSTREKNTWCGYARFEDENSAAFVSYSFPSDYTLTNATILARVCKALQRFCNAAGKVQESGFCCDCFTVLRMASSVETSRVVELCRIELSLAHMLLTELETMLSTCKYEGPCLVRAWDISVRILSRRSPQSTQSHFTSTEPRLPPGIFTEEVLHMSCLAVQFLCLGFLSYIQAHTGAIQPFFLDTALKEINLQGSIRYPGYPPIIARLCNLTCMGDMVNESVIVFSVDMKGLSVPKIPLGFRFDVLASAEDVVDTWGPGQFVRSAAGANEKNLCAINIGGGVIAADGKSGKLHWSPAGQFCGEVATTFDPGTKMLIGAGIRANKTCLGDENQRWLNSGESLENLGTFQGYWEAAERQAGFQTGQYFNFSYLETWAKTPTATLKQIQLGHPDNHLLPFLESPWGLQVSFCTGIARRVPLRELLADVMPAFVESLFPVPELWKNLVRDHDILDAFCSDKLQEWLGTLSVELQKQVAIIVRYILSVLQHTGVDKKGETFVIAWIRKNKPFQCFKISCEKESYWARILADSVDCATFAYVTSKCLETDGYECRGATAIWHNASALLGTAVCRHRPSGPSIGDSGSVLSAWTLKNAEKYVMGKPESLEWIQVDIRGQGAEPRLHVLPSTIPRGFRLRLDTKVLKTLYRLREKQALDALAENVVVLAGKPK